MLVLMPWILIVQLWTDPPPKIKLIFKKEYPNYQACMNARKEWDNKGLVALCSVKAPKESDQNP